MLIAFLFKHPDLDLIVPALGARVSLSTKRAVRKIFPSLETESPSKPVEGLKQRTENEK